MSTLENTISMMEKLPEADLIKIQDLICKLFRQREHEEADDAVGRVLNPMSREDFLKAVDIAEKDITAGRYKDAEGVFDELEQRYGF